MAASPRNKLLVAALLAVLGGFLNGSGAATAAEAARCTEDVVVDSDNFDGDYKKNNIQLKNVVISQCDIRVQAKSARANGLNIESAHWTFDGDVRIDVENRGNLRADQANVEFRNSQIAKLIITGSPAQFEQKRKDANDMARGHAQEIVYDVTGGTVRLANDAWLTYRSNDLKCARIMYDIRQELATCPGVPGSGQRATFTIPAKPRGGEGAAKPGDGSKGTTPAPATQPGTTAAPGSGAATPAPTPAPKAP